MAGNSNKKDNSYVDVSEKQEILENIRDRYGVGSKVNSFIEGQQISRRNFIKSLGLVSGSVALGALGFKVLEYEKKPGDTGLEESVTGMSTHSPQQESDGGNTETDSTLSSEYVAQEHEIEFINNGSEPVNYYFKVSSLTTDTGSTGSDTSGQVPVPDIRISCENTVDAVEDIGLDPNGNEPIQDKLENYDFPSSACVEFPEGSYRVSGGISLFVDTLKLKGENATLKYDSSVEGTRSPVITGNQVGFVGFDLDITDGEASPAHVFNAEEKLEIRDIRQIGRGQNDAYLFMAPRVTDENGRGLVQNIEAKVAKMTDYLRSSSRLGIFTGPVHRGELFIDNVDIRETSNNGIYASNSPGEIKISNSYFENCAPAAIRIEGENDYVKNCTIVNDLSELSHETPSLDNNWFMRGIWVFDRANQNFGALAGGTLIEDCDIYCGDISEDRTFAIRVDPGGGETTVRNTRIQMNSERPCISVRPPDTSHPGSYSIQVENCHLTGTTSMPAVSVSERDGYVENTCISVNGPRVEGIEDRGGQSSSCDPPKTANRPEF